MWFSRLDELEDEHGGHVPKANLVPSYEALSEAVGPFLAHAHGFREVAGPAFKWRVDRERPFNLVNCWYMGQEPSELMWANYANDKGDVAIRSVVRQVGAALHHPPATHGVSTKPDAIRFTRTGARSSARFAIRAGSAPRPPSS